MCRQSGVKSSVPKSVAFSAQNVPLSAREFLDLTVFTYFMLSASGLPQESSWILRPNQLKVYVAIPYLARSFQVVPGP